MGHVVQSYNKAMISGIGVELFINRILCCDWKMDSEMTR